MVNAKAWRPLDRPELGALDSISRMIHAEEWRDPDLLTSVRLGPTLVVASDYGGEHRSSNYLSLSYLVADSRFLWLWDEIRSEVRRSILKDSRRMAYKSLGDRRRARALPPFLKAADPIPGLLATFLIDKRVQTLFQHDSGDGRLGRPIVERGNWRPGSFEKLLRVAHLGAMLVSGLCAPGQNLIWFTDQDEIVSNVGKHREATAVIGNCLNHLVSHGMGHFRLATTQSDTGRRDLEDLVALPDLAAGALAEVASFMARRGSFPPRGHMRKPGDGMASKAEAILGWLAERRHALKRLTFCVEFVPPDGFRSSLLRTSVGLESPSSLLMEPRYFSTQASAIRMSSATLSRPGMGPKKEALGGSRSTSAWEGTR